MVWEWESSIFDLFVGCLSDSLGLEDLGLVWVLACNSWVHSRWFSLGRGLGEVFASLQKDILVVSPFLHSFTPRICRIAMSIPLDEFIHWNFQVLWVFFPLPRANAKFPPSLVLWEHLDGFSWLVAFEYGWQLKISNEVWGGFRFSMGYLQHINVQNFLMCAGLFGGRIINLPKDRPVTPRHKRYSPHKTIICSCTRWVCGLNCIKELHICEG